MRSADVIQLRVGNLKEGNPPEYEMDKTGKLMSMKLKEFDWRIIRLFGDPAAATRKSDYLFGLLDDNARYTRYVAFADKQQMPEEIDRILYNKISSIQTMINKNLKERARLAGIDEKITFHTARHSFADKARRKMKETSNVTIDDIRNSLGHARLETTQRYLASFDREGLDVAMDAIFDD
jgi:integrase/recombinase XerD